MAVAAAARGRARRPARGQFALAQAPIYLALAPKSNAAYKAIGAARAPRARARRQPPPAYLRTPPTRGRDSAAARATTTPTTAPGTSAPQELLPEAWPARASTRPTRPRRRCASACRRSGRPAGADDVGCRAERVALAHWSGVANVLFPAPTPSPGGLRVRVAPAPPSDLAGLLASARPRGAGGDDELQAPSALLRFDPRRACRRVRHGLGRRHRDGWSASRRPRLRRDEPDVLLADEGSRPGRHRRAAH